MVNAMQENNQERQIQNHLKKGEKFLDFLNQQIQLSAELKIGFRNLFSTSPKREQGRYADFQKEYALWMKENFVLRRQLLFENHADIKKKEPLLNALGSVSKSVEGLFDSWEDTVEGHRTAQTDSLKVTIPMIAVVVSLISFIISLVK